MEWNVIPIINENDTVAVDEIKFGDNDHLAAVVANITEADLVISMTNTDGLYDRNPKAPGVKKAKLIGVVREITDDIESMATAEADPTGMGGMRSKILAARKVTACGIPYIIARGKKKGILGEIFAGKDVGTLFTPMTECLSSREYWIAFTLRSRGKLFVDDGARKAIVENGKSLLPSGIEKVEGEFAVGDPGARQRGKTNCTIRPAVQLVVSNQPHDPAIDNRQGSKNQEHWTKIVRDYLFRHSPKDDKRRSWPHQPKHIPQSTPGVHFSNIDQVKGKQSQPETRSQQHKYSQ